MIIRSLVMLLGLWLAQLLCLLPTHAQLVIDHTCTQVERIPAEWIETIRNSNLLIQCVGESHGRQIEHGLLKLEEMDPRFQVQLSPALEELQEMGVLRVLRAQRSEYKSWYDTVGEELYWATESARQYTERTALYSREQNQLLRFSCWFWSWDIASSNLCSDETGAKITFNDERLSAYFNAIRRFNDHPDFDTQFIYLTSVTDTLPNEMGARVTHYNEMIRDYVQQHGGVLFDQGDIENWSLNGTERRVDEWEGQTLYLRHADYDESVGIPYNAGHTNEALTIQKAKALWWMLARLSGWGGPNAEPTPTPTIDPPTPTGIATFTYTPTLLPSLTPTLSPTLMPSATPTFTLLPTLISTSSPTYTPTWTPTLTPISTLMPSATPNFPTPTPTPTSTPDETGIPEWGIHK